ncbi:hypothetical protein BCE02nite_45570 [Brevibacillus centrosporus]|nr:hypothetical protein BCE02nite_45570 [Brevibacillus centrosporus]
MRAFLCPPMQWERMAQVSLSPSDQMLGAGASGIQLFGARLLIVVFVQHVCSGKMWLV